ncbi:MAG TPA: cyclase family protein [Kineosporiaceae bacterium]|nr:cyclase family protein [Kineosporiaceae bacterium]
MSAVNLNLRRRGLFGAVLSAPLLLAGRSASAAETTSSGAAGRPRIPRGYEHVDPRTARRVPLWQPLSPADPIFPGDPKFTYRIADTIKKDGYLLEQITSLGTHTGTHVSAPAHFHEGAPYLNQLDESWTLMPLVVLDVRDRVARSGGDFTVGVPDLQRYERRHGRIPAGGCVLLLTGFGKLYFKPKGKGKADDYFDPAPGLDGKAVTWLFDERHVKATGSDTFGPDATSDEDFSATSITLAKGGITVENVGPGLARMRPHGDWISINGARPRFSGFQMGITGFTR